MASFLRLVKVCHILTGGLTRTKFGLPIAFANLTLLTKLGQPSKSAVVSLFIFEIGNRLGLILVDILISGPWIANETNGDKNGSV